MGLLDAPALSPKTALSTLMQERALGAKRTALRTYDAAIAARNIDIVCVGDSKTEGARASTRSNRWIEMLTADLRTRYNPAGVVGGIGYVPAWYGSPTFTTPPAARWTWTNVNPTNQAVGLGKRHAEMTAAGQKGTITATYTSAKLFFTAHGTAAEAVSITIDGGAPVVFNLPSSGTGGLNLSGTTWTTPVAAAASHTIEVAYSAGAAPSLEGAYFYNGDESSGVRAWDAGHGGYTANNYAIWFAPQTAAGWARALLPIQPALVVIALGTNDYRVATRTPAQFGTDLAEIIRSVRVYAPKASIVLMMLEEPLASGTTPLAPYVDYAAQAHLIAATDTLAVGGGSGVTVLDLSTRMARSNLDTLGLHDGDALHFSDRGNRQIADTLLGFLTAA